MSPHTVYDNRAVFTSMTFLFCQALQKPLPRVRVRVTSTWSVFMQPVRTNNDCEGWHIRLNNKANRAGLNVYQLIKLLHRESMCVDIGLQLLSDKRVCRRQRKAYRSCSAKLHEYWQQYLTGTRSTRRLLKACARLYGPVDTK